MNKKNHPLTIALDAGGTEIKAGLLRGSDVLMSKRWPTERENGPAHAVSQILLAADQMSAEFPEAEAIGLVVPGVVNTQTGVAEYSENIGWNDIPFVKLIQELTRIPVGFDHDVRAGGSAESVFGAGRGFQNSFFMPIGTGISGAITINGHQLDDPFSGEIGHLDVKSGLDCACESSGCLETVSTGPSIIRAYNLQSKTQLNDAREVVQAAQSGDLIAERVWANAVEAIAFALNAYINILSPEIIILGGGISKAGESLLNPINKYLNNRLTFLPCPKIVLAELGDHAGMIGAGIAAAKALIR